MPVREGGAVVDAEEIKRLREAEIAARLAHSDKLYQVLESMAARQKRLEDRLERRKIRHRAKQEKLAAELEAALSDLEATKAELTEARKKISGFHEELKNYGEIKRKLSEFEGDFKAERARWKNHIRRLQNHIAARGILDEMEQPQSSEAASPAPVQTPRPRWSRARPASRPAPEPSAAPTRKRPRAPLSQRSVQSEIVVEHFVAPAKTDVQGRENESDSSEFSHGFEEPAAGSRPAKRKRSKRAPRRTDENFSLSLGPGDMIEAARPTPPARRRPSATVKSELAFSTPVPQPPPPRRPVHTLETSRRKDERQAMPGFDCSQCREWYEIVKDTVKDNPELLGTTLCNHTSRHRRKFPIPKSPPNFWDTSFSQPKKSCGP